MNKPLILAQIVTLSKLHRVGITKSRQCLLLMCIKLNPGVRVESLANIAGDDPANIHGAMRVLVDRGLITVKKQRDKSVSFCKFFLTEKGEAITS